MTLQVQIFLILGSLAFFFYLVQSIRKSKLSTDHAVLWILWGFGVVIIAIFPQIVYSFTRAIGIDAPISAVFLIMIFLLYCLVYYLFLRISTIEDKLKNVIHELALMKKEEDEEKEELDTISKKKAQ